MSLLQLGFLLSFLIASSNAFTPINNVVKNSRSTTVVSMGLIDDLKLIFSEEGKANRAAYDKRQKDEQERAQQEILERRRNPNKMRKYEEDVVERRSGLDEERSVWDFQNNNTGEDPMNAWNRLRREGKIKVGSELERDPTTSRLGSEGLVDVRTDERLPYIDQGYVDEDSDVMGNFMKMFGGGKKKDN